MTNISSWATDGSIFCCCLGCVLMVWNDKTCFCMCSTENQIIKKHAEAINVLVCFFLYATKLILQISLRSCTHYIKEISLHSSSLMTAATSLVISPNNFDWIFCSFWFTIVLVKVQVWVQCIGRNIISQGTSKTLLARDPDLFLIASVVWVVISSLLGSIAWQLYKLLMGTMPIHFRFRASSEVLDQLKNWRTLVI